MSTPGTRDWLHCTSITTGIVGAALFTALFVLTGRAILRETGHIAYGLDDPYIHMAIAKSLARHGVWGITPDSFAAASSSPLWTGLVAAVFLATGVHDAVPLLLNVLIAVCGIVLLGAALRQERLSPPTAARPGAPLWIVDAMAVAAVWLVVDSGAARCLAIQGTWVPDLDAAAVLCSASPGRLVLPFDWGEYAIWHFGPALRVSMDGRRGTVYSQQTIELQDAVMSGSPEGIAYLLRERPEYIWMKSDAGAVREALNGAGYRVDVSTARSFVASRGDAPAPHATAAMPACFP